MEIVSIVDTGLGNSSYLIDLGEGQGLVIDAERDPAPYLAAAEARNLRLRWAVETHLHADFVSGGRELAAGGAQLLAPKASDLAFDHFGLSDGDEVDLGGLTLRTIATPGHTPEHCSYLLTDGPNPLALFSGGTLIAGGVARTDLITPELTEELARAAYRSIHDVLLALPDALPVYPTHGAGSFCSTAASGERTTTIGRERTANQLLQADDEDDFVGRLLGEYGSFPSYFLRLRDVNRSGPKVYGTEPPALTALSPSQVADLMSGDAEVVDARPIGRFAAGHIPGSISIAFGESFASWLGWLVEPDREIVFVADSGQDLADIVRQALKVGYERFAGYLEGGIPAWIADDRSIEQLPVVAPMDIPDGAPIVDVRQQNEWDAGHVPGALHVELGKVAEHTDRLPVNAVVHCVHGQRAMTAASLMQRAGLTGIAVSSAGAADLIRNRANATP